MIRAGTRGIKHSDPILQNFHPRIAQASDYGPAHRRAKERIVDTGQARHRIPKIRAQLPCQGFTGENLDGLGYFVGARSHGGGIDANFLDRGFVIGAVHRSRGGLGGRG